MNEPLINQDNAAPVSVQPKTPTQRKIESLIEERDEINSQIVWLEANQTVIDALSIAPALYCHGLDFDHATREQVLEVIKAFPGVWDKKINGTDATKMDYERRAQDKGEPRVRIWCGALPPSCKIVEEWVDLPPQPATRVLKKVVKCSEKVEATV